MKHSKNKIKKLLEASIRESRKEQGFFDGRFNNKSHRSKKTYTRKIKHKNNFY